MLIIRSNLSNVPQQRNQNVQMRNLLLIAELFRESRLYPPVSKSKPACLPFSVKFSSPSRKQVNNPVTITDYVTIRRKIKSHVTLLKFILVAHTLEHSNYLGTGDIDWLVRIYCRGSCSSTLDKSQREDGLDRDYFTVLNGSALFTQMQQCLISTKNMN